MDIAKKIRVIKVISSKSILINAGSADGITYDSRFRVIGIGESVYDHEANEDLGELEYVKANIRPMNIMERMTECVNARKISGLSSQIDIVDFADAYDLEVNPNDLYSYFNLEKRIAEGDIVRIFE